MCVLDEEKGVEAELGGMEKTDVIGEGRGKTGDCIWRVGIMGKEEGGHAELLTTYLEVWEGQV